MVGTQMTQPNLFEQYFDYLGKTEAPLIFHRWSLIVALGAYLGRQAWIELGHQKIYPNQYVMLIGQSGSRKSTAIRIAKKFIQKAGYDKFSAQKTTKEKFLLDLEGAEDEEDQEGGMESFLAKELKSDQPCEVFIVADEFNDFMRCQDMEFHSLLGSLWDAEGTYSQRLKNSKSISINDPTVSLLGGNTHEGFAEMFPPQAIGQGFLSRMLLVFSEPSGIRIAFPEPPNPVLETALIDRLQTIKASFIGPVQLDRRARESLTVLYNTYEGFTDIRFTSYFTRRHTHLLKMCLLCAAANGKRAIGLEEVLLANTILSYTEHFMSNALGGFGKARHADVTNKILQHLAKVSPPRPQTLEDLWQVVSNDMDRLEDLQKLMYGLVSAHRVISAKVNNVYGFLIIRKSFDNKNLYVDYNLLREYERVKI